jgi:hypothetical protein
MNCLWENNDADGYLSVFWPLIQMLFHGDSISPELLIFEKLSDNLNNICMLQLTK